MLIYIGYFGLIFKGNILRVSIKTYFFIFLSSLQIGCSSVSDKLVIPDGSPKATIKLIASGMGRHDETRLSISGPVVCESFAWETHATRKSTSVVSLSLGQSEKSANIPADKDTLFVVGQNIGDRSGAIFWEMFVKPNAKYEVIIGNEFKDKFLFGSYANTMSIVILENATPIKINQVAPPVEADCIH